MGTKGAARTYGSRFPLRLIQELCFRHLCPITAEENDAPLIVVIVLLQEIAGLQHDSTNE